MERGVADDGWREASSPAVEGEGAIGSAPDYAEVLISSLIYVLLGEPCIGQISVGLEYNP